MIRAEPLLNYYEISMNKTRLKCYLKLVSEPKLKNALESEENVS